MWPLIKVMRTNYSASLTNMEFPGVLPGSFLKQCSDPMNELSPQPSKAKPPPPISPNTRKVKET